MAAGKKGTVGTESLGIPDRSRPEPDSRNEFGAHLDSGAREASSGMTRINAHCRVPLAGSRVDHAGCGGTAFTGHISKLSHRAVFRSVGKIRVRRLHFCI